MIKVYFDSNILIEIALNSDSTFLELIFLLINEEFKNYNYFYISDLVFNETHAGLANKIGITNSNKFLKELLSFNSKNESNFGIDLHNPNNHSKAFELSNNPNYIEGGKGLSMVDSHLLIQMEEINGVIYSKDKRMSYYHTSNNIQVARWVNF